jgi:hypothetical protein
MGEQAQQLRRWAAAGGARGLACRAAGTPAVPPMRPATSLSLAVLAACTAVDAWSRRDRQSWFAERAVTVASAVPPPVSVPRPQDPPRQRPAPQEPRYIDQVEPPRVGNRMDSRAPMTARLQAGFGRVDARIDSRLDDRADARFLGVGLESGRGVGAFLELWTSDGDLFAGRRVNDGIDPVRADASFHGADLCVYYHRDPLRGDLRLPWRVGLFTDLQRLDQEHAPVQRDWLSTGVRVVVEPTWRLVGNDERALELVGRFGVDVGATWFREHFRNGGDRDETWRWSGDAGLAVRGRLGDVDLELGYRLTHTQYAAIDSELFGDHDRCDFRRQQVFVSLGFTW